MLYFIAVLLGVVVGTSIVADRTLTACAKKPKRYPAMPPASPLRKRYIECMGLSAIIWLGCAFYLYTEVGHIGWPPFAIIAAVSFISYHGCKRLDRSIHDRFGNAPL